MGKHWVNRAPGAPCPRGDVNFRLFPIYVIRRIIAKEGLGRAAPCVTWAIAYDSGISLRGHHILYRIQLGDIKARLRDALDDP